MVKRRKLEEDFEKHVFDDKFSSQEIEVVSPCPKPKTKSKSKLKKITEFFSPSENNDFKAKESFTRSHVILTIQKPYSTFKNYFVESLIVNNEVVFRQDREIGLRKALGATQNTILLQFIIEAITLCLIGGFIGVILGTSIYFLIAFLQVPFWQA